MKRNLEFRKKQTPVIVRKGIISSLIPKQSPVALMHLWHLSTIPSFWVEYFAERLLKVVF